MHHVKCRHFASGPPWLRSMSPTRFDGLSDGAVKCVQLLRSAGIPPVGLQLVALCYLAGLVEGQATFDLVEFFAGQQSICRGFRARGLRAYAFERDLKPISDDIMSAAGLLHALSLVLRVRGGGVVWFGVVCSSWVWISRSSTQRSEVRPMGRDSANNANANAMVSRVMLLLRIANARAIMTVLEQPTSSLMPSHPRFQQVLRDVRIFRTR